MKVCNSIVPSYLVTFVQLISTYFDKCHLCVTLLRSSKMSRLTQPTESSDESSTIINSTDDSKLLSLSSASPITHTNAVVCSCGCVPKGIPSLFEMAQKRKEFLERKKKEAEMSKISETSS